MPNVITHGLMANEVVQVLNESSVAKAIESAPRAFFFGSNGPDFLFYYRFLSKDEDARTIRHLGSIFHDEYINEFYSAAKRIISSLKEPQRKIATAYIAGHICHWALDSLAHPYIFHKTGLIEGDTRYDHYRMEAMIDTLVVKRVKNVKFRSVPSYKFVELNKEEAIVIAKVYQGIIKETLGQRIELKKIHRAITSMYKYNRLLWDKTGLRTKVISSIEKNILKDPWIFSSHFVTPKVDLHHDLLNLRRGAWSHPCNPNEVYTTSFMDLFKQSIVRGTEALDRFSKDLETGTELLEEFVDHRDYSSGLKDTPLMTNFSYIYEH